MWQELVNTDGWEGKAALLADPAWRARARISWDNQFAHSLLHHPAANLLRESESGFGPIGVTLADYMVQTGIVHASDALAEWVLNNGQESTVLKQSWAKDEGIFLSPEGAATTAGYAHLLATGFLKPKDRVVLFNTGAGLKYTDVTAEAMGLRRLGP